MRLIDADALEDKVANLYTEGKEATEGDKVINNVIDIIDNAPTVEERPKYILKVKNLTAEDKKRFQEEWNKSAGGLLAVPDDYEIVPLSTTKLVTVTNKQGKEFEAYYDESRELVFAQSYTRELLISLGYTITNKEEQLRDCGADMRGGNT